MGFRNSWTIAAFLGATVFLSGCEDGKMPGFLQKRDAGASTSGTESTSSRSVERDVEAPEVFQISEPGLWDGRPSLGGVWVAHTDAQDPERVIIRNASNGKFVIGALFRRERDVPGPRFQVSSDAAEALGMLAGQPIELNVTALRKEEVVEPPVEDPESAPTEDLAPADEIETASLDPIAAAAAALDKAEGVATAAGPAMAADATKPVAAPKPAPKPATKPVSALSKPFIQIGIFSVESNANDTAQSMRTAGMLPAIKKGESSGKAFWRVVVGPATSSAERATLLKKIKGLGFTDAYFVTN